MIFKNCIKSSKPFCSLASPKLRCRYWAEGICLTPNTWVHFSIQFLILPVCKSAFENPMLPKQGHTFLVHAAVCYGRRVLRRDRSRMGVWSGVRWLFCVSLKIFVCSTFAESTYLALGVLRKQSMLLCHVRFNEILRFMDPQILQRDTGLASGIRTEEDWKTEWTDSCFSLSEAAETLAFPLRERIAHNVSWKCAFCQGKHKLCVGCNFSPLFAAPETRWKHKAPVLSKASKKRTEENLFLNFQLQFQANWLKHLNKTNVKFIAKPRLSVTTSGSKVSCYSNRRKVNEHFML